MNTQSPLLHDSKSSDHPVVQSVPTELLLDGKWLASTHRRTFPVNDPATNQVIAEVADATPEDALAALDAADTAFPQWSRVPARERSDVLRRTFDLLIKRSEEFALLMTAEMGKTLPEARAEVVYGAEYLRWYSEEAPRVHGRYGSNPEGNGRVIVSRHPVGPCYLITPWNFPLTMATRKIAPAIAAGCTAVVKPAESAPLTTLKFARLLQEAGLPDGVVNVVPTSDPATITGALLRDSRLKKVSFTGSTAVGVRLLEQASSGVLRSSMELGGNAPFIVFEDADINAAVDGAMVAKFRNTGQACTAANRFLIHRSIAQEFRTRFSERISSLRMGRGTDEGITVGPLINDRAVEKATELIDDAVRRGAHRITTHHELPTEGSFMAPTILTNVDCGSRILREEIFGPVVAIVEFDSEDEAVKIANDTEYGLVSYAYTQNLSRAQRLIEGLETGMLALNSGTVSNAAAPFGGWKHSGLGREGAEEGLHEYLQLKYTLTATPFG